MKARRIIYLIVFLMAAVFIFKYGDNRQIVFYPDSISKQDVLKDFADLSDNKNIPAGELGGNYFATEVFFPDDYIGDQGDEFYVTLEDGHMQLTQKYLIEKVATKGDKSGILKYKLKENWENFKPPAGKYESYKFDGKKWTKVDAPKQ